MKRKQLGILAAVVLFGAAATITFSELDAIQTQLETKPTKPVPRKLSPEERAARAKTTEEQRLQRVQAERKELDAEMDTLHGEFEAKVRAFLAPDARWKPVPEGTSRVLLSSDKRPVFWRNSGVYDNEGCDLSLDRSVRDLLAGKTSILICEARPLLIDSKKRVWFGYFSAPVPATQPGESRWKIASQDLVVYEDGNLRPIRKNLLKKVTNDPTTQGMLAAAAGYGHGFEDSEGNLYFIGGLGGWFSYVERLDTQGNWSRIDSKGSGSVILERPQFTDLKDGRIVFSVDEASDRRKPIEIVICDGGEWIAPLLKFSDQGEGYLSDVSIAGDGKVVFVDQDRIIMYDLDGYSQVRLARRLEVLVADLGMRDPEARNRAEAALAQFPRQAIPQIKALAEKTPVLDTRKRLESAIADIESGQQTPRPLDGRFIPREVVLLGKLKSGEIRFAAAEVEDLRSDKPLGASLLTYTPKEGWSVQPLMLNGSEPQLMLHTLMGFGHGRADEQGRIWFPDTSHLDTEGHLQEGDLPGAFDEAPVIDAAGRLYYSGMFVGRDRNMHFTGVFGCNPEVRATKLQIAAFRQRIPGTKEWWALRPPAKEKAAAKQASPETEDASTVQPGQDDHQ